MYFSELKLAVSLAVISIFTLIVPYLSLSITMDRKKSYNVVFIPLCDGNGIKIRRVTNFYAINFMVRHI